MPSTTETFPPSEGKCRSPEPRPPCVQNTQLPLNILPTTHKEKSVVMALRITSENRTHLS